ncbi:autotransporter domain-containing protein [Taklimakanibacter deserti]|uniref:autotransporter domain-containing protein n=1 Tax=Taklimakanibacter deserti TaxID=2267839 RepID=UPI000E65E13A
MGKPLNWMLSDTPARKATSRLLRSRLAATTILAVVPFLGYGRQAYAYCTSGSATIVCSGTETFIDHNDTDAAVETAPPSLTVTEGGVRVTGEGLIQFLDDNASSITNLDGHGLEVIADDGLEPPPVGRINVFANGTAITAIEGSGIYTRNFGSGETTIMVTGDALITGTTSDTEFPYPVADGINAYNRGTDLTITTDANTIVRGAHNGIDAVNLGFAYDPAEDGSDLTINANGIVYGYGYDAIYARNGYNGGIVAGDLTITTGALSVVKGAGHGIQALNYGDGELRIEANGIVGGYAQGAYQGDGIHASNSWNGKALTITTGPGSTVRGEGDDGIDARQNANWDLTIDVNGSVTGVGNTYEDYPAFGIAATHGGDVFEDGVVDITVGGGGLVQGETGGIGVWSTARDISIYNAGMVRNLSGESHDLAIITNAEAYFCDYYCYYVGSGNTHVDNRANLIGTVRFEAAEGNDTLDNHGFWNMAGGDSDFGGQEDYDLLNYDIQYQGGGYDVVNNTGTLVAADDSSNPETSRIFNLEKFNNDGGLISLLDGDHDDTLVLTSQTQFDFENGIGTPALAYTGTNGRLAVDANLGQGNDPETDHLSDELFVIGSTAGTTTVHVNVVGANGANLVGIPVVRIVGTQSAEDQFNLAGPINGGFFVWDMRFDPLNNWHELYTVTENPDGSGDPVVGPGAFEFPAGFGATQDIWFQTIGTVLQRQADLRPLLQGLGVTPVADYSEPVEPTPIAGAIMAPGFWFKGFGTYIDLDDEENGYDLDRKQTIYGGMAGFDFGTKEAFGDAWLFGVFGGYVGSDLDFKATNTEWDFQGPMVGAYVTYLDQAFYADATVRVDFLDIDIDPQDLGGDDSDTDAVNVGGRLDTGYKFGHTAYIEPQASLAVVYTEIDDVDVFGGTVEFDDDTSVRGRLGLRFGVDHTHTDATVYSADVTASVWQTLTGGDSDVTIVDTGVPDFGASDDQSSTFGDISLGLGVANPDGWSSFVRGNYLFADDYEAFTGNAGVRFVW